jgi:hypothetical protein
MIDRNESTNPNNFYQRPQIKKIIETYNYKNNEFDKDFKDFGLFFVYKKGEKKPHDYFKM